MNNVQKSENKFFKILKVAKVSFLTQFTWGRLLIAAVIATVALLGPIIQLSINDLEKTQASRMAPLLLTIQKIPQVPTNLKPNEETLQQLIKLTNTIAALGKYKARLVSITIANLSFNMLAQVFSTSILYALGWGVFSTLRDKNSVDRNRVMYIGFNKHSILFSKIFMASLMFIMVVVSADVIGIALVKIVGKGYISTQFVKQLCLQLVGMFVFYFFIQIVLRLITARITSKKIKGFASATWLLSTAFLYVVLSIVLGVVPEAVTTIKNNQYLYSFMPIINITILPMVLYGNVEAWTIAPFIIEYSIIIGLVWRPTSSAVKNYLCS